MVKEKGKRGVSSRGWVAEAACAAAGSEFVHFQMSCGHSICGLCRAQYSPSSPHCEYIPATILRIKQTAMCECVEESMFAGGGPIVATEHFVPATLQTKFTSPSGLCTSPNGSLVVSDHKHSGVFLIEGGRTHLESSTDGGSEATTETRLINPFGVACLEDGSILVADMHDNTIKKLKDGCVSIFAGSSHRGGEDGDFRSAEFDKPKCLCITPRGDVLVSEVGKHRIRLIILDYGGVVVTVAGEGPKGYREGKARQALFSHPSGLCCTRMDPTLMFLTYRPYHKSGNDSEEESSDEAGGVRLAKCPGAADQESPKYSTEDQFDDILIFVSDTQNHRIRVINNGAVWSVAGNGRPGLADGPCNLAQFDHPANICMAQRSILVADHRNDRIRFIDLQTDLVSSVHSSTFLSPSPSLGDPIYRVEEHNQGVLRLERPSCLCMNEEGDVFVSCEYETHAEIHLLSRFAPMSADTVKSQGYLGNATRHNIQSSDVSCASEQSQQLSNMADVGDEALEFQIQQLNISGHATSAATSPRGHIGSLVARERSKSVDTGTPTHLSHGYQGWKRASTSSTQSTVEEPGGRSSEEENRGFVSRLSRMLSLDEEAMVNRVDTLLEKFGLPPVGRKPERLRYEDLQPFEPEMYDKPSTGAAVPPPTRPGHADTASSASVSTKIESQEAHAKSPIEHDDIDPDEVATF